MSATIPGMRAASLAASPEPAPRWLVTLIVDGVVVDAVPPCSYALASFHADNWRLAAMRAIDRAEVCLIPSTPKVRR
jgi:hypothetical protein